MATRKILAVIIALAMVLGMLVCLSGCSDKKEFELTESEVGGLVAISRLNGFIEEYNYNQTILYDPDTLVMYSMISFGSGISITVLYNADGTPKLYNPEK
ncbi:MAG: hypothetical protein IKT41_00935 [Clostridia bacterium]|nr:hypothetical protein [Clostridia bacterium]